jgi:hypothetical protein
MTETAKPLAPRRERLPDRRDAIETAARGAVVASLALHSPEGADLHRPRQTVVQSFLPKPGNTAG